MAQRQNHSHFQIAFATLLTITTNQSPAAGFALIEQSVGGLGNAYAGAAASAEDASTVFYNPAGLMFLKGNQGVGAGHVIVPSAKFTNSGSALNPLVGGGAISGGNGGDAGSTSLVPNFYYANQLANGFVLGLGVNAPFGLKTEYDSNWVGRYHAIESELQTVNINPAIAYNASDDVAVGVGVSAQYADATLTNAIDFGTVCLGSPLAAACPGAGVLPQTADGSGRVEGDDWGFGFNFGILYSIADTSRVGFSYRSKIKQTLEGDVDFTVPTRFATLLAGAGSTQFSDTGAKASTTLPESASLSLYHELDHRWTMLADATWTRWSRFDELRVEFDNPVQADNVTPENWNNSMRYSLGVNYRYDTQWLLRAGIAYDETPISSATDRTPRIPDNSRRWLAVGARYRASDTLSMDVGYAHLFIGDAAIDNTNSLGHTLTGEYESSVDILSAQANWTF